MIDWLKSGSTGTVFQADRVPPDDVLRVCYFCWLIIIILILLLDNVKKEAETKLPAPWIVVEDSDNLAVAIVENKTLSWTMHAEIQSDLSTFVPVLEIPAFHLNKNLECLHLKTFLSGLASRWL